ncbi:hypothetical protein EYF80_043075 [Liparis tanakae]|uniref:Uncharacterized protein n=1 Tax=Liparis tanakae TaxID=230148 RepID=A0A4Z2FZG8_9TELE|nr:hypothetical protein EYF80_043075 [Liparis tanakae]
MACTLGNETGIIASARAMVSALLFLPISLQQELRLGPVPCYQSFIISGATYLFHLLGLLLPNCTLNGQMSALKARRQAGEQIITFPSRDKEERSRMSDWDQAGSLFIRGGGETLGIGREGLLWLLWKNVCFALSLKEPDTEDVDLYLRRHQGKPKQLLMKGQWQSVRISEEGQHGPAGLARYKLPKSSVGVNASVTAFAGMPAPCRPVDPCSFVDELCAQYSVSCSGYVHTTTSLQYLSYVDACSVPTTPAPYNCDKTLIWRASEVTRPGAAESLNQRLLEAHWDGTTTSSPRTTDGLDLCYLDPSPCMPYHGKSFQQSEKECSRPVTKGPEHFPGRRKLAGIPAGSRGHSAVSRSGALRRH